MIDKLINLNPKWLSSGGEGITDEKGKPIPLTEKAALELDCPCGCGERICIPFIGYKNNWNKSNDSFENLTVTPSIQRLIGCKIHFVITSGNITP